MKRLASRVRSIDIFGSGHVIHHGEEWEITAIGRVFLHSLEAVTQDNLPDEDAPPPSDSAGGDAERASGELIVVGHRFKSRLRPRAVEARPRSFKSSSEV